MPPSESLPAEDRSRRLRSIAARARPAVRASAITLVLAVWILSALPSQPLDAERLARPTHAGTVRQLEHALTMLGVRTSRAEVDETLIAVSTPVVALRNTLMAPFQPLFEFAGMGQRWGLFLQTGRTGYRIRIDGRSATGNFRLLYRPHTDDPLGLGSTLAFRRMRGIYNPGSKGTPRAQFEGFVTWLSSALFAKHPDLDVIRVRMQRLRLGTRSEPTTLVDVAHESERVREAPAS